MLSQFIASTQFYLFGRSRFTATGWAKASKAYIDDIESMDLEGKVFCVTGANSGIGREATRFLASRGARVVMVCRNRERGEKARGEMEGKLELVVGDVSLARSTMEVAREVSRLAPALDGLVCNAGALSAEKTMTAEGVETTFAAHLAFGSYLLARELKEALRRAPEPRVVFVTSGGMYNSNFAGVSACVDPDKYDGQFAYVYAKRGQVLLAEALEDDKITYVSSHPGWTDTPGVDDAFGGQKKWLQPLRSLWQGAEGMCWLCCVDKTKIEPGALYLDRKPQRKHLAGPFFTDGTATKNTPDQVRAMLDDLENLCDEKLR